MASQHNSSILPRLPCLYVLYTPLYPPYILLVNQGYQTDTALSEQHKMSGCSLIMSLCCLQQHNHLVALICSLSHCEVYTEQCMLPTPSPKRNLTFSPIWVSKGSREIVSPSYVLLLYDFEDLSMFVYSTQLYLGEYTTLYLGECTNPPYTDW